MAPECRTQNVLIFFSLGPPDGMGTGGRQICAGGYQVCARGRQVCLSCVPMCVRCGATKSGWSRDHCADPNVSDPSIDPNVSGRPKCLRSIGPSPMAVRPPHRNYLRLCTDARTYNTRTSKQVGIREKQTCVISSVLPLPFSRPMRGEAFWTDARKGF